MTAVGTIVLIVAPFVFYIFSCSKEKKSHLEKRFLRVLAQVEQ